MNVTAELSLSDLLARAGAVIRSRSRADCPRCKRPRSVSFDEMNRVFHCHGAGCDFSGGVAKLASELGLARRISPGERELLRREHDLGDRAARALWVRVQARRFELLEELRSLGRLAATALRFGDDPSTWDALALANVKRPALLVELTILENCGAADLFRFLSAGPELRGQVIDSVLTAGGLYNSRAQFVEILL